VVNDTSKVVGVITRHDLADGERGLLLSEVVTEKKDEETNAKKLPAVQKPRKKAEQLNTSNEDAEEHGVVVPEAGYHELEQIEEHS